MKIITVLAATFGLAIGIATARTAAQTPAPAAPPDPAKVAAGKLVYDTQKCATCHAIDKVGSKLASDLKGVGTRVTPEDLKKWFTNTVDMEKKLAKKPTVPMSNWLKTHKQTDPDIELLVAYLRSLK